MGMVVCICNPIYEGDIDRKIAIQDGLCKTHTHTPTHTHERRENLHLSVFSRE
jgi:hypothetical protein